MLGKPTVAIVPPNFNRATGGNGSGANRPTALSTPESFAASTFTTDASIKALRTVSKRTLAAPLTT